MDCANLLCSPELCVLRVGASAGDWMTAYLDYLVIACLYLGLLVLMVYGCYALVRDLIEDFSLWVLVALVWLSSATILLSFQWVMIIRSMM